MPSFVLQITKITSFGNLVYKWCQSENFENLRINENPILEIAIFERWKITRSKKYIFLWFPNSIWPKENWCLLGSTKNTEKSSTLIHMPKHYSTVDEKQNLLIYDLSISSKYSSLVSIIFYILYFCFLMNPVRYCRWNRLFWNIPLLLILDLRNEHWV